MRNYLKINNLNFQKRLFRLLFFLLLCTNAVAQNVCRPISQTNSEGGILCIGLNVDNPNNAFDVDAGLSTYATLNNAIGVGCFVQETLTFNQTAKAGDQVVFYIGTGNGLLDLSLLSNVSVQARLSGTDVGPRVALNSPLLNLDLLNGNTIAMIKYTLQADANQIQIRVGGLLSLLVSLRLYDVRLDFAKPTISGGLNQTICSGNAVTLTATPAANTTIAWYSSVVSTTPLATTNSFTTPVLTANTTYYIGVSRFTGCEGSERLPVVINVSNPVAPAINNSGTSICTSGANQQTTLSVINPVLGTTYGWFSTASGGVALASGTSYSPTVPVGVTNFYVEASIGSCVSPSRTQVTVIATPIPAAATVLTQSVTIQSGQNATLSAMTTEPNVTLNWFDVPTGGVAIASNTSSFTTPILTASKTYYVEAESAAGNCVSTVRVPVTVTVIPAPLGTCLEASSQQTFANGLCLLCGVTNSNFSVDGNIATATRLSVPVGLVNAYIQQTLQFNNPGRAGDIIDVEMELPAGVLDVGLLDYISLATYNSATFNNDRISINNLLNVQLLGGNRFRASIVAGAAFDRVEVRLGGVASVLTSLDIYNASYRYKAPSITGNTTICSGQTTTLTAALGVGETVAWYDASTGGTLLASTASYTTPVLTGATTYYVQLTRNGCVNSERTSVQVNVNNPIAPTIAATGTIICAGNATTLTITNPVTGTDYRWYDAVIGDTLLATGNSFTTPILTINTSYYVEAGIGTCTSIGRTQVAVTVNPLPTAPTVASANVTIQSGQSALLMVSNPEVGVTYEWFDASNDQSKFVGTAYQTDPLTANASYYIIATNTASGCINPARTTVNVIVNKPLTGCLRGNAVTTTYDGILCVLCAVNSPNNSVDTDIDSAASLSIPLGLGQDVFQEIDFTNSGLQGDIIEVELGVPGGLLDISLLSNITLQSYNGASNNPDLTAVNNPLLNIQLLGGNRFRASFAAGGDFTGVRVTLGGLLTALARLDIYNASYRYKEAVIAGNTTICEGNTTTLTASSSVGTETFLWYATPNGLTPLDAVPSPTYTTPVLTATTNYYLEATRGTCANSVRQIVTVTVLPKSVAADIIINSPLIASCTGEVTLAPSSALAGAQFKYYANPDKTGEITTGINGATGALTITGLTALGSPYTYYISVSNALQCENEASTLKQVVVNFPAVTTFNVTATLAGCDKANLKDAIQNIDNSGSTIYTFFDASNNPITVDVASNITISGDYYIQAQGSIGNCSSDRKLVTVTISPSPTLVAADPVTVAPNAGPIALAATSNGTLSWFDPQGNPLPANPSVTLTTPGIYAYTVVATLGNCSKTDTFFINVIDPNTCQSLTERVYANNQSSGSIVTGTVSNGSNAIDGDVKTFSTITTGLGLLGIGTTWQNLQWSAPIAQGTPVTVKLGSEYSGVALAENLSVVGFRNGVQIGNFQSVSGSLLNVLAGDNSFEFTFVPADATGPKEYDEIRIQSSSLLSVAQNTKVYEAYYSRQVATVTCTPGDIKDVFYGATDLGVGVATATVGVSDAWNVADGDASSYATMYSGAGILAAADLTVLFKTPSIASDTLRIVVSKPAVLLTAGVLTGLTIQRFLGNVPVGAPIDNTSSILEVKLLNGGLSSAVVVFSQPEAYDKVRIRFGGVAGVLDFLRVHTVERLANTKVIGSDINNKVIVCPGTPITLSIPEENCAKYAWYDSATGGNQITTGVSYTLPAGIPAGIYRFYIQSIRYDCENLARGEVIVEVKATAPQGAIANITLNGGTDTTICSSTGSVTLQTAVTGTPALTNPVYYWYQFNGTTSQLIEGETSNQLLLTGLLPGTYTYYVGVSSDEFCETAPADRKSVTFTILPESKATDIQLNNASVCSNVPASLTPTTTLINPVFTWYLDNNKTQPVTNGVPAGVTYTISPTGVLTVTGLTKALSPISYYVAVSSDTSCENLAGDLKVGTIIVTDPDTPTTTSNPQSFCTVDAPTFASIQVNESNVVWYATPTGGAEIPLTTLLTSGTYYGAIRDSATGCESSVRLQVAITVTNPGIPSTLNASQSFCAVDSPTFANIQVNQTNIIWYANPTGGTAIAVTTVLTTGVYYAAIKDAVTGCESATRLQITITVTDPGTPSTSNASQSFCSANTPTFASIQVNQTNIVWYATPTGGTAIAATTALTTGVYYAAIKDAVTGCESVIRLQITVTVSNPATPTTTDNTQEFCSSNAPTVANIQVNESNVVWYSAPTGGTALPVTTALTNGIYYGAISQGVGCESTTRLQVTVTINTPGATPTTNATTQNFCSISTPTVANIQVNEANVVWYSTPTGGTVLPATTPLVSGLYYGAISNTAGCENSVRLVVTVNVNIPGVITTPNTTQNFCLSAVPTIASLVVNETNVVWYSTPIGGTPLATNIPLIATTYYASAAINATNGCESATRLAIVVGFVNDASVPITASDDTTCVFQGVTYSIANGKSSYVWSVTNGTITSGGGSNDGNVTISWPFVGPGKVEVTYTNTCDETTTKSLDVTVATCSDLTITNTVSNPTPNFGDEVVFTITVNNVGQGTILNTLVSELIPSGYSFVSATTSAGVYDTGTQVWTIPTLNGGESQTLQVRVIVLPTGNYLNVATIEISTPLDVDPTNNSASASVQPICLTVYNEFTPNNDGANDLFRIDCIESYPNNELKVFNRWGALVYSKLNYENDWNGTANVSGTISRGDLLPTGTYFYVIDIGNGTVKKGWLSIMR
nr:gliding motility-associated C-terminal domain-containing protein [uncultured Flavobacterium sp.]